MLIDEIVGFCHSELHNTECHGCKSFSVCNNDCKACLDDLHFHRNIIRDDYDCIRLLDYYVCRYSYKYCSEIIYALESVDLSHYQFFNILSLGCGGAADLMAFDYLNYPQRVYYLGLDKNPLWESIHREIEARFTEGTAKFYQDVDVLDYFSTAAIPECNVLIIEYLISFFFHSIGKAGVIEWFEELVEQVIKQKPSGSPFLVIINDVDSINTGRDTFLYLKKIIERNGLEVTFEKRMRFKDESYFPNSIKYPSKQNMFSIPFFVKENYCPAINCESAQLILEVK